MHSSYLLIGMITRPHGLKGEVSVMPLTDFPQRFKKTKKVYLFEPGADKYFSPKGSLRDGQIMPQPFEAEITGVKFLKKQIVCRFSHITDYDSAQKMRQKLIAIDREDAVKLPANSYYVVDMIGSKVLSEDGRELGAISDIFSTGASDVYVIPRKGRSDLLIPGVKEFVLSVDIEKKEVMVKLPEGLEDI